MKELIFQKDPIDTNSYIDKTNADSDGALIVFVGKAKNKSKGKNVLYLDYEIYESMAEKEMDKIVNEAFSRWSITNCIVIHRYGKVKIGESSIMILVSSPHRDESYQASRYIIDTIKKTVPIWKKEIYSDGSEWISDRC